MADQTRIAFRTPNGNAKWQKVSMMKVAPAKDGDVVVRLAEPLQAGGHLFHLESSSREGVLLTPGADFQFMFLATVTDPADYQRRVEALLNGANNAMVGLVKP